MPFHWYRISHQPRFGNIKRTGQDCQLVLLRQILPVHIRTDIILFNTDIVLFRIRTAQLQYVNLAQPTLTHQKS